MTEEVNETNQLSESNIYNASQIRFDNWNRLKNTTSRLSSASQNGKDIERYRDRANQLLDQLFPIEMYWAFPGRKSFQQLREMLWSGEYKNLNQIVRRIVRALMSDAYRKSNIDLGLSQDERSEASILINEDEKESDSKKTKRPYFEVLVVDNVSSDQEDLERQNFKEIRRFNDAFTYEPVFVKSFEDALIAILVNHNLQAIVIRYDFELRSQHGLEIMEDRFNQLTGKDFSDVELTLQAPTLAEAIKKLRPELDIYLVTDQSVEEIASLVTNYCRRVFYNQEDYLELHLNILRGVQSRYKTPFFSALKEYSKQPTGVFHAMPISRGKSISKSNWIKDMGEFYGMNTFLAETSATSGGLDSLLDPTGPIKEAQELASRAFGSRQTFFATNGTSTCNKIVVQALAKPNDIVLVDRDCHKSHHYGMVLAGADVVYLDSYPLHQYSMYGAVPLEEIKRRLLELKATGKLDRVKMLTFDGLIYNVAEVMQQCLAIKPDLVFLWDEAWFGFARFGTTYRKRTAMYCAQNLRNKYRSDEYREQYTEYLENISHIGEDDIDTWIKTPLMPDPQQVRIRVYATQSTHKTLTSLRQGSMIHIFDQDYNAKVEEPFHEAYMTHTSTSPNYQILASLDIGRRQVELEGYELVQKQVDMAQVLRNLVNKHTLLKKYFKVLGVEDMIPAEFRSSGQNYYQLETSRKNFWTAWGQDEFVLDATRVTLYIANLGVDGDTFKTKYLMDKFGIQINKTSRNTVLFMTNIGTTRSSVAYLIEVLIQIAEEMDEKLAQTSKAEQSPILCVKIYHLYLILVILKNLSKQIQLEPLRKEISAVHFSSPMMMSAVSI